ncbi:hypothetical protein LTR08_006230 [Meristemomyces frigidus]|nr:hypothetical protein LTR08_006230 [Meristemomyces frigidus]
MALPQTSAYQVFFTRETTARLAEDPDYLPTTPQLHLAAMKTPLEPGAAGRGGGAWPCGVRGPGLIQQAMLVDDILDGKPAAEPLVPGPRSGEVAAGVPEEEDLYGVTPSRAGALKAPAARERVAAAPSTSDDGGDGRDPNDRRERRYEGSD